MRLIRFSLLVILSILLCTTNTQANVNNLYIETTNGYYNVDGEILRFESEREFTIQDYSFFELNISGSLVDYVNISMIDGGTNGIVEPVVQLMEITNFVPIFYFNNDTSLHKIEWNVKLFRLPQADQGNPFEDDGMFTDRSLGHRTYDRFVESFKFSSSLEYYEYQVINGETQKLWVNTELATDNYDDGRAYRTALHIVKRNPDNQIVFSYTYDIKEANTVERLWNLFDRPDDQLVPFQLGAVLLGVYLYIRISRYVRENNIRIVKGDETNGEEESDTKG